MRFAVDMGDWILFDNTGLKGKAAKWAKENLIHSQLPELESYYSDEENIKLHLAKCNKAIYSIGFEKKQLPIEALPSYKHNPHNGIIAPGLFGVGIAYPEQTVDRQGNVELSVGLWKFMSYLERVMPVWLNYP